MKTIKLLLILLLISGCSQKNEIKFGATKFDADYRKTITFSAVGDNLIHGSIYRDAYEDGSYDFSKMYENILDLVDKDISFINQETPIGGSKLGISGYPLFNSPTELVNDLYEAGFNLINLATNHSLDKSEKAILNELEEFSKYEMVYDGVYASQEEFDTIKTFEVEGITFSFLAYTYGTNGIKAPHSYTVSYLNESQIRKDVEKAKEISDFIIVSAHWGSENTFTPTASEKKYAQLFADLGVDVVIGTHPHVLQPIEWVEGKSGNKTLVAYSLGNFLAGMISINNAVNGVLQFDIVQINDEFEIQNIQFVPLFIHFEQFGPNWVDQRDNFKIYKISEYTDELAKKHALNNYNYQNVTISNIKKIVNKVIDDKYLEDSWKASK